MKKSPSTSESKDEIQRKLLLWFHIILTILWITGAIFLFVRYGSKDIQLNELGDYVAGVASPAAFYWLIVGFFLQRSELELQRKELELARDQLTRQASALEETSDLHRKTFSLNEREAEHSELQNLLETVPSRMEPIVEFLLSLRTLKSCNEDKTVSFLPFAEDRPKQVDVIKKFNIHAYGWPEERFGTLLDCMKSSKPHDFYNFERELDHIKRWFHETNQRALKAEAPFFYQGCKQAKLILLLETFNNLMEPDADWGLHIGSDR